MKKLLTLVALAFVVALCMPCYGGFVNKTVLVYKLTATFNPLIDYNDANEDLA
jgi:hypothetical protein